jgi:mono/diheme cytochrome c family protein
MSGKSLAALVVSVTALAGCGGSSTSSAPSGRALFARDCSACHSLTGVESPKHQGGDLLHADFSHTAMLQFAREMPVRTPLTRTELERVADYVVSVERGAG